MGEPFFSVVVPCLNEEYWLPRLVEGLARQTDRDFEVIVVDGGSTDATEVKVRAFGFRVPSFQWMNAPRGVSIQKNIGAKRATGKYLLFFDADVLPEDRFIEMMKHRVTRSGVTMATVWNRADCSHVACNFVTSFISVGMVLFQKIKPGAVGVCIVVQRKFFLTIGGFNEAVLDGEDWELTSRTVRLGATFKVFRRPRLWVSARRVEKEGLWNMTRWFVKFALLMLMQGAIKKKVFEYNMGGHEFMDQRPPK